MNNNCMHDKFEPIKEEDINGITMIYGLKCRECKEEFIIKPITKKDFYEIATENNLI